MAFLDIFKKFTGEEEKEPAPGIGITRKIGEQKEEKQGILERIFGSAEYVGKGGNQVDLSGLSDPQQIEAAPPTQVPVEQPVVEQPEVQPAPQEQPQTDDVSIKWEEAGRPAVNPYADLMVKVFGEEAPEFERILRWGVPDDQGYGVNYGGENLSYDAGAVNHNENGTVDTGLFQINEPTFNDFMNRRGERLSAHNITSYQDMLDPEKNMRMAKIIYDEQGPQNAWYGSEQYKEANGQ